MHGSESAGTHGLVWSTKNVRQRQEVHHLYNRCVHEICGTRCSPWQTRRNRCWGCLWEMAVQTWLTTGTGLWSRKGVLQSNFGHTPEASGSLQNQDFTLPSSDKCSGGKMQPNNCSIPQNSGGEGYSGLGALHGPNGICLQHQFPSHNQNFSLWDHLWYPSKDSTLPNPGNPSPLWRGCGNRSLQANEDYSRHQQADRSRKHVWCTGTEHCRPQQEGDSP